ncbi:amidinotransferase [Candidatus Saccharibacteria bacterium]|nr:amidinotransferase [Candidatus Saccharibacteria bacterium]MCA9328145.1 amidinotransferase [Candidatus Saccharibacteria bacterium]
MHAINTKVLMSGAEYFSDQDAINAHMGGTTHVDLEKAIAEHAAIQRAFEEAGIEVIKVEAPAGCQDGVYTANWALIHGKKALMANLPNTRQSEEPYAEQVLRDMDYEIVKFPREFRFSGQGDALPCGKYLFTGTTYRTSPEMHPLLAHETGLHIINVQTVPQLDENGKAVINAVTGWPDSFFYDLDLAIAVIRPNLIAWCPDAFTPESRARIETLSDIEKIEVNYEEAVKASACNLVSTGETVVMSSRAPKLKAALEQQGLHVTTVDITELMKGGGFIRCTSLTLSNNN